MYTSFSRRSPLFLVALILNLCGLVVIFASSCALRASGFTWFVVGYLFCLIFGISVATFGGFIRKLRLAFLPLIAVAIMFLVIEIDDTIYSKVTSIVALGSGCILAAIGMFTWMFGLGFDGDQHIEDDQSAYSSDMIESNASPQLGEIDHHIMQGRNSTSTTGMGYYPSLIQNPKYTYKARAIYSCNQSFRYCNVKQSN
ncbi:Transmembrane osmosensor, variant 2 [Basidiobolus ranarum]|uniref:Transmembrane osmosensor, variant 2 n=1 Tax=Basidiobolus ranarum TaxID=34480 RepID=A0ABR2VTD6_9FUNG